MVDPNPVVVKPTVASLADVQGFVTVYDHGPQPPPADATQPVKDVAAADKKAWDVLHGDVPVTLRMASGDAATAMQADPARYSLEPLDLDEGAVTAKMTEIRTKREAAVKAKEDAADRQTAIQLVMSDRANVQAKAVADKAVVKPEPKRPVPPARPAPPANPVPPATPKT